MRNQLRSVVFRLPALLVVAALAALLALGSPGGGAALAQTPAPEGICGRTEPVRDAIMAKLVDIDNCANVRDADLGEITGTLAPAMSVQDGNLFVHHSMAAGDLDGLESLTGLNFKSNSTSLPDGLLDDLYDLESFQLLPGQLTTLRSDVFENTDELKTLVVTDNELTSVPENLLEGLDNLELLNLRTNQLTAVPSGLLINQENLEQLDLGENRLASLDADLFRNLGSLEVLELSGNSSLSALPEGILHPLTSLKQLNLGSCGITSLDSDVFEGLSELESVILAGNQLSEIPDRLFFGLTSLSEVNFAGNPGADFALPVKPEVHTVDHERAVLWFTAAKGMPMSITLSPGSSDVSFTPDRVLHTGGDALSPNFTAVRPGGVKRAEVYTSHFRWELRNELHEPLGLEGFYLDEMAGVDIVWNDAATGSARIGGVAQVGHELVADTSTIRDADVPDMNEVEFTYRWYAGGEAIDGANSSTYRVQSGDSGKVITLHVSFTHPLGAVEYTETLVSSATTAVVEGGL